MPVRKEFSAAQNIFSMEAVIIPQVLPDEKIFDSLLATCRDISAVVKGAGGGSRFQDLLAGGDNGFLLTVLINIYSFMLREDIEGGSSLLPADILIGASEAEKVVKILLAIKKGLKNNLNIRNFLKGMLSSIADMKRTGFPEPDFSWL